MLSIAQALIWALEQWPEDESPNIGGAVWICGDHAGYGPLRLRAKGTVLHAGLI